ncbi:MAG: hypothetical protein R2712_04005 [Vicinamibacterales bacterium]
MRAPRVWTNLLVLPEADIALGPLPVPGVGIKVNSGYSVEVTGSNFTYLVRVAGFGNLDAAERWLEQDLRRQGLSDIRWIRPDRSRIFLARRHATQPTAHVGWIAHAGGEGAGPVTIVEDTGATVRTNADFKRAAETVVGAANLWLRAFEHPDDAIVHAILQSSDLDLRFRLPAGTVPSGFAFGMVQTTRAGRYGPCRFVADGIAARDGRDTRALADALAADPGVRDAQVRMVDADVAEVHGTLHDDMEQTSTLACRIVPADEGAGLFVAALTLDGEPIAEARKFLATATTTVQGMGAAPRPVPDDLPASAADALRIVDSFRRRLAPGGERVRAAGA